MDRAMERKIEFSGLEDILNISAINRHQADEIIANGLTSSWYDRELYLNNNICRSGYSSGALFYGGKQIKTLVEFRKYRSNQLIEPNSSHVVILKRREVIANIFLGRRLVLDEIYTKENEVGLCDSSFKFYTTYLNDMIMNFSNRQTTDWNIAAAIIINSNCEVNNILYEDDDL